MESVKSVELLLFFAFLVCAQTLVVTNNTQEIETYELKYYQEFLDFTENFNAKGKVINFYFYGEKNETGNSFCSDCDAAEPVVQEALKLLGEDTVFVAVNVGTKDMWKDKNNSFRTDERTLLKSIPTLLRWKHERKLQLKTLEENELLSKKYLEWFFYVQENFLKKDDSNDHTERYELKYHDEFVNFAKNFNSKEKLLSFYFYGEKNETGNSFCSDCDAAMPHVEEALKLYGENVVFVEVNVGSKDMWKDTNNSFRTDETTLLTCIPTMIRWDKPKKRLEEQEFLSKIFFEWFFRV